MFPANFAESNLALSKPDVMTDDECSPLCVWAGADANALPVFISCWKPTQEELDEINRTGRVWAIVHGAAMQPILLSGVSPFRVERKT